MLSMVKIEILIANFTKLALTNTANSIGTKYNPNWRYVLKINSASSSF